MNFCFTLLLIVLTSIITKAQSIFPNSDFETGTTAGCHCPTGYTCSNDAGRVVMGIHPVFVVGNQGCVTSPTNYSNSLGARSGTGHVYFYAGLDAVTSPASSFSAGQQVCICVYYAGPQGAGASGQNTANCYFRLGVDGVSVSANIPVPVNTPWTQFCQTVTMTAGSHTFNILSGGAAQYSIWFDDFTVTISACGTLPVQFLSFNAYQTGLGTDIMWQCIQDERTEKFELEKSENGSDFMVLANIPAKHNNSICQYFYTDYGPSQEEVYYRIKTTDKDGKSYLSQVWTVKGKNLSDKYSAVEIFPVPANDKIAVRLQNLHPAANIKIFDSVGREVLFQSLYSLHSTINISDWQEGLYVVQVYDGSQMSYHKILISH